MVYLDNAASTKPSDKVIEMFNDVIDMYANPSSVHDFGRQVARLVDMSREEIRERIGANSKANLLFTSGATMSNNILIQGFMNRYQDAALIVSEIEHQDILLLARYLKKRGRKVYFIPVYQDGTICEGTLENICFQMKRKGQKFLCSIQAANGECGVIQDYTMISKIVHMYGGIYHSDITQYIPYYPIDLSYIDAFSMSGQKIGCIKGTGLLYIKNGITIDPVIFGEQGLVGGTENVPGIACLGAAFANLSRDNNTMCLLRDKMFKELGSYGKILGSVKYRLPNNVYMSFDRSMITMLSNFEIMASAGSACAKSEPSHVVLAMGYNEQVAKNAVRFSLSHQTTKAEIDKVVDTVKRILWIKDDKDEK